MTRPRSPRPRLGVPNEPVRSAKALPRSTNVDAQLAELSARCEVQRLELHAAARALAESRTSAVRVQRQLRQLKARLTLSDERAARLEEEAAMAYALAREGEARASAQVGQVLAEADERLAAERRETAAEIANLRDALAAALERERTFRRVETDLRRQLAAHSDGTRGNPWETEDTRVTVNAVDSGEAAASGSPLVP